MKNLLREGILMKKLIYKYDYVIKDCFIGNSTRDLTIMGRIYKIKIKFLWWTKVFYTYTITTPYIKKPYYNGEFDTNTILKSYSKLVKQVLIDEINKFKR